MRLIRAICLLMSIQSAPLRAAILIQGISGVMLQPNSQYFHTIHGAALSLTSTSSPLLATLTYTERPKFTASGFTDQEQGIFATIGRSIPLPAKLSLHASAGAGQQRGWIEQHAEGIRRGYALSGIVAQGELLYTRSLLSVGLGLLTFVGIDGHEQLGSYVAWPFNYFHLTLGMSL